MKELKHLYFREVAKNLNGNGAFDHTRAVEHTNKRFISEGFSESKVQEFELSIGDPKATFPVKAVLNPNYLKDKLGVQVCYFVCDARSGRYPYIKDITKKYEGLASRYIVYGPEDSILQITGIEDDFNKTFGDLSSADLMAYDLRVDRSQFYRGFPVEPWQEPENDISVQDINFLVEDFFAPGHEKLRNTLMDCKIILGGTLIEDFQKTERIPALVGLNIGGRPNLKVNQELLSWFLNDTLISRVLIGFHSLTSGSAYNYLIEIVCDLPSDLDEATDRFNEILKAKAPNLNAETSTYIYAKSYEVLPRYLGANITDPLKYTDKSEAAYLQKIKQEYISPLPKDSHRIYAEMPEAGRIDLLIFLFEMSQLLSSEFIEEKDTLHQSLSKVAQGQITGSERDLTEGISPLFRLVENTAKVAAEKLVNLFFRDNREAIKKLGVAAKPSSQWTLGECSTAFRSMNGIDLYQMVGVNFPEVFFQEFDAFISLRNDVTHGRTRPTWDNNQKLLTDFQENFRRGLRVIAYLKEHVLDAQFSISPKQFVLAQVKQQEGSSDLLNALQALEQKLDKVEEKVNDLSPEIREAFTTVIVQLGVVEFEAKAGRERTKSMLEAILKNETAILEHVQQPQKSSLQKVFHTLKTSSKEVTWNTMGSLLAQIILSVGPEYAKGLLATLSTLAK